MGFQVIIDMDTFKEELYGKVLWECYRSKVYIVLLSLMYVAISVGAIVGAIVYGMAYWLLAAVVVLFALWRINRVHHPVALICERRLLVAVPWSFFNFDYYITFQALYMPVEYKDVAGISSHWDRLYIGAPSVGGLVALPVQLAYVSGSDKAGLEDWLEAKRRER